MLIKELVKKNIHIYNFGMQARHHNMNRKILELSNETSKMDLSAPIESYIDVKQRMNEFYKKTNRLFTYECPYAESLHYGHLDALLDYGELSNSEALYMPIIEHGLMLDNMVRGEHLSRIYAGPYRKHIIHGNKPYMPAFCIGPYIHYAKPFYDLNKTEMIKKQYGKTLLIMPQHTFEGGHAEYNSRRFVEDILKKYSSKFDTVMACLYWNDFDSHLYKALISFDIKIVSAGFRFDKQFLKRLKTILEISDFVVGNSIGSHIGYCLQMGKPFDYLESDILNCGQPFNSKPTDQIVSAILNNSVDEQKHRLDSYFGFKHVKTPEEIKAIAIIGHIIVRNAYGDISKWQMGVQKTLKQLKEFRTEKENALLYYNLLRNSISDDVKMTV